MNIWSSIKQFRLALLQSDSMYSSKTSFLLLLSLFVCVLLLIYTLLHIVQAQYTLALISSSLLTLILANLVWMERIKDFSISGSIFLSLIFGHNCLALIHEHMVHIGLYCSVLFPIFAYKLKGREGGLWWSILMISFVALFLFAVQKEMLTSSYTPDQLLSVLINTLVVTLFSAIYFHFNIQQSLSESQHEHLRYLATHDELTGLLNRSAFLQCMEDSLNKSNQAELSFALMFLDLDRFKAINDHYGHVVGDQVLQMVGHRLQHCIRGSDLVCRYGGDEFLLLLHNISPTQSKSVIHKLQKQFLMPFAVGGENIHLNASIGVSFCPHDHQSISELIDQADKEMYVQKKSAKITQV